jgi:hypothetical protein
MKKVLSIVLTIAMVMSFMPSVVFAADSATYSDISGKKCEAAVEQLSELGVVNGYEDGTFRPDNPVTRAEMSKLTVAALGLDPTSGTSNFTDMDQAKWAIPYVGYAESLGIVNGYGNGKFGPNDKVTYDQAITMIVRALGYTTDCNEMKGTWPAVYVQKANELGILKDVNKTGSDPANRGDIAIMLANALNVPLVYADNDGNTQPKSGAKNTMYKILTKESTTGYATVDDDMVNAAAKNIRESLGAAGKVVTNDDGDVISVSDIKTQFMTGDFKDGKFESDDVKYTVASDPFKVLDEDGKAKEAGRDGIPVFANGKWSANATSVSALPRTDVTLAVTVSGKKITGIYSAQTWTANARAQVADADLAQIEKNHKLLQQTFAENNDGDIDENSFILAGVDSLDKIAEDNIVYVYKAEGGDITKIEVGTEVVSGTVSKSGSDYAVINGEKYKLATFGGANPDMTAVDVQDIKAGNEVDLYLDYSGKIAKASKVSSGNYAVVMVKEDYTASGTFASATRVRLLTENGVEIFDVNTKKVSAEQYRAVAVGDIVQYSVSDEKVTEITKQTPTTPIESAVKVTKKGFLGVDGDQLADSSLIFSVPTADITNTTAWEGDAEDYVVLKKADVLEKTINTGKYFVKDGKIEAIIIDDGATADSEYGVFTDSFDIDGGIGVDYYIDKTATTDGELESSTAPTLGTALYKISVSTADKVKYEAVTAAATQESAATSASKDSVKFGTTTYNLADDVVIYVWDAEKGELDADGTTSDLIDEGIDNVYLYKTAGANDDNYGLVTYIIVVKNTPAPAPAPVDDPTNEPTTNTEG